MTLIPFAKRAAAYALTFGLAYTIAGYLFFPSARRNVHGFVKALGPAELDHDRPAKALQQGEIAAFPKLEPLNGEMPTLPNGVTFVVTVFDSSCRNIPRAAGFMNRVTSTLAGSGVQHVIAGCGPSKSDFANFIQGNGLKAPAFYTTCEALDPRMKLLGGVRHYVFSADMKVLDAWAGVPIFRYAERDMVAQIVQATTWR